MVFESSITIPFTPVSADSSTCSFCAARVAGREDAPFASDQEYSTFPILRSAVCPLRSSRSDPDHLEILLARAALGAGPVERDVRPARPGCDSLVWQTRSLVVDEPAHQAHPAPEFLLLFGHLVAMSWVKIDRHLSPLRACVRTRSGHFSS